MKILVTGATGFVGRRLCRELVRRGYPLHILTRDTKDLQFPYPCQPFEWKRGQPIAPKAFSGVEAVVHLAGAPIVGRRWTASYKQELHESRIQSTQHLVKSIQELGPHVKTFLSASAIGYYGEAGSQILTEAEGTRGEDFLAKLCQSWELQALALKGVRTVTPRIGLVLGRGSGLIDRLHSLFQRGLGSPLGNAQQWMSWIHIDDLVQFFCKSLQDTSFQGPYNLTSPSPISNREFMKEMGKTLGTFVAPSVPYLALYLTQGPVAPYMVASQRVLPQRLLDRQFPFKYVKLSEALSQLLPDNPFDSEFHVDQWLMGSPSEVFQFFADEKNLEKITPPWVKLRVLKKSTTEIQLGTLIDYKLRLRRCPPMGWRTKITHWNPPHGFSDVQIKGPYKKWEHTHRFERVAGGTLMTDQVCFRVPMAHLGNIFLVSFVRNEVKKIFSYRSRVIKQIFS